MGTGRLSRALLGAARGRAASWLRLAASQTSPGPRGLLKLIAFLPEASESRPPAFNSNLLNNSPRDQLVQGQPLNQPLDEMGLARCLPAHPCHRAKGVVSAGAGAWLGAALAWL